MTFDVDIWHGEVNFSAYVYNNTNTEEEKNTIQRGEKHNTVRKNDRAKYAETNID